MEEPSPRRSNDRPELVENRDETAPPTAGEAATQILAEGFRDTLTISVVQATVYKRLAFGRAAGLQRGRAADVLLLITLDVSESELAEYGWIEIREGKTISLVGQCSTKEKNYSSGWHV